MSTRSSSPAQPSLRAWLEFVVSTAIDWLDELDAQAEDLEDDELGDEMAARHE